MNTTAGGCGIGLAKERARKIAEIVPGGGEERDVKNVEKVGTEFEAEPFVETDVFRQSPIEIEEVVHALGVTAAGAVVAEEGLHVFETGGVGGAIDAAKSGGGDGGAIAEREGGTAGDTGGAGVIESTGDVAVHVDIRESETSAAHHGVGDAGLVLIDRGEGPAAEDAASGAFLLPIERELPDMRQDETVGDIVRRRAAFGLIVELILGITAIRGGLTGAVVGAVIDGAGPGVAGLNGEATGEGFAELGLEGVVDGAAVVADEIDGVEAGIDAKGGRGGGTTVDARGELLELGEPGLLVGEAGGGGGALSGVSGVAGSKRGEGGAFGGNVGHVDDHVGS